MSFHSIIDSIKHSEVAGLPYLMLLSLHRLMIEKNNYHEEANSNKMHFNTSHYIDSFPC